MTRDIAMRRSVETPFFASIGGLARRTWRIAAFLAFALMAGSLCAVEGGEERGSAPGIVLAQSGGTCVHGEYQCQVGEVMFCDCSEGPCQWAPVGESCGAPPPPPPPPPQCTKSFEGATHMFPDELKTCKCSVDSGRCYWF